MICGKVFHISSDPSGQISSSLTRLAQLLG